MKTVCKILTGCSVLLASFTPCILAQETNLAAAQAWSALTNMSLLRPPMAWATNPPTQADLAKFDDEQAAHAGALADRARDFYTRFHDNANVSRARVTEVQALQLAVHYGATNRLADLIAREAAIVADTNAPVELRYQLRLDQIGRELPAESANGVDAKTALERAGRELVKDFPNGSAGYNILMDLATDADLLKMHELAILMANSGGPPELTDLGKGLQRRIDAIGKPLAITFTTADGRAVNLTTLSNKVVLVDFWATWCPGCVTMAPEIKKLYDQFHAKGFDVVGINFDDDTNQARQFIRDHDLTWPQYFGGRGPGNKFGREYSISALPAMWLVDRKGVVRDIHGTTALEAKVAKLMAE
jgi:thiol-disulfide isomerase/thioredoxin